MGGAGGGCRRWLQRQRQRRQQQQRRQRRSGDSGGGDRRVAVAGWRRSASQSQKRFLCWYYTPLSNLVFSVSIFNMLRRTLLLLLLAATAARRLSPSPVVPASKERSNKKKVLMLISDTGGGHRASAHALEAARCVEAVLLRVRPVARGLSAASDPWPLAWPHRRPRTPAPAQAMHRFVKTRAARPPHPPPSLSALHGTARRRRC